MSFFVGRNDTGLDDQMMSADWLVKNNSDYYSPRFDAIKELREQDDGSLHRGNDFRRVASLVNVPLLTVIQMQKPDFFKNKRAFYAWLDRHPEYCTYQRRRHREPGHVAGGILAPGPLAGFEAVDPTPEPEPTEEPCPSP